MGLLALGVACGRTPPPSAELRLETLDLREGQELGAARDADPVAPGFQLDVAIRVTDVNGQPVPIGSATLQWREEPDAQFGEKTQGTVDGAQARFTGLTLPASEVILRIEATEKEGPRSITILRRLRLSFDDTRPVVTGWSLPADANGDGTLNIAELAAGPVVMRIDALGMAGGTAKVRLRDTGAELGSVEVTGEEVEIPLTQLDATGEREVDFRIELTNALGNTNDPGDVNGYGRFAVDALAPNLTLLSPSAAVLGLASDADGAPGYQLLARARTSADVGDEGLSFTLAPQGGEGSTRTATPTENEAGVLFTLDAGAEHALTLTVRATDLAGNPSVARVHEVLVDLAPPVISEVASPAPGTTYGNTELSVEATVSGADGRSLEVFRVQGGTRTSVGAVPVVAGSAVGTLSFAPGTFDVAFEVADAAGNRAATEVAGVTVNTVGCAIQITSPANRPMLYGRAHDVDAGTAGLQTVVEGTSPECAGQQVSLSRSGGPIEASAVISPDGSFSIPVTLAHGESTRLSVSVANPYSVITSDFVDVSVDLVAPSVDAVSPDAAALTFVAATNVNLGTAGYVLDEVPGGDAQASFLLTVSGEIGDQVFALYAGQNVSPVHTLTNTTQTVELALELPHGTDGTLEFIGQDAAGNRGILGRATVVDVIAPATPAVTANVTHARRATVDVSWTASGDDGAAGSVAGYDFRYSTSAVLEFGIETEEQFFASEGAEPLTKRVDPGLIPAGTLHRTLTLPPFARYSFQVRAVDEVGNYSAFEAIPVVDNSGGNITLTNPAISTRFGIRVATGDFDGDGVDDLAVGDDNAYAMYVYRGGPTLHDDAPWITLTTPTAPDGNFGTSPAAGDFDGDGVADLMTGASTWSANRGRAFLYLGAPGTGLSHTPAVEFRGEPGLDSVFGSHIKAVPDLNGDGIDEVAVVASRGVIGQVYLFFGRSLGDWITLATGSDAGDPTMYVPASAADVIFSGPSMPPESEHPNADFGRNAVIVALGDTDGDGITELAIAASLGSVDTVYVYRGSDVLLKSAQVPGHRTMVVTEALLSIPAPAQGLDMNSSFGFQMLGNVDVVGDARADLVVAYPRASRLLVYEGQSGGAFQLHSIVGSLPSSNFFGYALAGGDLNGDGRVDLVVGGNPASGSSSAWGLYHSGDPSNPYDLDLPGFNMTRQRGPRTRGVFMHVADVTGDGVPDVIVSDPRDEGGKVYVRH